MKNKEISVDIPLKAEFYDVDSMNIVWHGNYVKYYEQVRCVLMDKIGYSYIQMGQSGYSWPVVKLEVKYIKSLVFSQKFHIKATLKEYEHRLRITYLVYDKETGKKINKGETIQMAIEEKTGKTQFVSPQVLLNCVENYKKENNT